MDNVKELKKDILIEIIFGSIFSALLVAFLFIDTHNPIGSFSTKAGELSSGNTKILKIILLIIVGIYALIFLFGIICKLFIKNETVLEKEKSIYQTANIVPLLFALFLMVDSIFMSPVRISGNSMNNTYKDNDLVACSKIPEIKRDDVVIVEKSKDYLIIKRVVAVPGDTLLVTENGEVYVNSILIEDSKNYHSSKVITYNRTLGEDEYYVLGDNRDISADSRLIGIITKDKLCGKVIFSITPFRTKIEKEIKH